MQISEQLSELLNTVISVMIVPLLPVLTAFIIAFIRKKTQELDEQIKNMTVKKYLNLAENAVITAVTAVNQIYVDELKRKNGTLSPQEQKIAFQLARDKVVNIMGDTAVEALKHSFTDFDAWLGNKIEYYVFQSKNHNQQLTLPRLMF